MKKTFFSSSCMIILFLCSSFLPGETPLWVKKMKDPKVNIYEVKKEFDSYFKNHPKGKGTGWKQFQRWFHYMEPRCFPSGERLGLNPGQSWLEWQKFKGEGNDE